MRARRASAARRTPRPALPAPVTARVLTPDRDATAVGQWLGRFEGTNTGLCFLNVDPDQPLRGTLQVFDAAPPFSAVLNLGLDGSALRGTLSDFILQPLPNSPAPIPEQSPTSASIEGSIDRGALTARWRTNVGTSGTVALLRSEPSSFRPADHVFSWAEFMKWALDEAIRNPELIFRGQCS